MGKYAVILADPPWEGGSNHFVWPPIRQRLQRAGMPLPRPHYQTLKFMDLCALPVRDMAADTAALFLWVTMPHLPLAFPLMEAWGFKYITCGFTWIKTRTDGQPTHKALGCYTKANAELCLIGKRGNPAKLRKARDVTQVIMAMRREHSRKPDEQYERIMRLFDGPYLELFARQQWPGWDVWGNEAGKFPAQPFLFSEASA